MSDFWDILNTPIMVPQWYLVAFGISAMIITAVVFLLVDYFSYRLALLKVAQLDRGQKEPSRVPSATSTASTSSVKPKPVPPMRQHYWYYVAGVSGRFATLREALSASGVNVPSEKMLDWKKLTADTRAKIKRVRVKAKQPSLLEQVVAVPQAEAKGTVENKSEPQQELGAVVKPIGGGAFVTFKKKPK